MRKFISIILVTLILGLSIPVLASGMNNGCAHRPERFIDRGHNYDADEHTYGLVCGICGKEYEIVTFWCPGGPIHCEPF